MGETSDSNATPDIEQNAPRAIIHKQILDHAEANPDESMEAIADAVSGATTATVERVLEEYGDPAADAAGEPAPTDGSSTAETRTPETEAATSDAESDGAEPSTDGAESPSVEADGDQLVSDSDCAVADGGATSESADAGMTGDPPTGKPAPAEREGEGDADRDGGTDSPLDRSTLTEKQHETLRAIYHHPDATQAELADRLGVSSPTISQRVNSIDGFDWSDRNALVAPLFGSGDGEGGERVPHADGPDSSGRDGDEGPGGDATDRSRDGPSDRARRRGDPSAARSDREPADAADRTSEDAQPAGLVDRVDELADRLAAVERELGDLERGTVGRERDAESSVLADPELAHKIVHACLQSDRVSEEEELRLLRDVTASGAAAGTDGNSTGSV